MTSGPGLQAYVLDTHALFWYWNRPASLSAAAQAAFGAIERGDALGLVPLLVVAELHYLSRRLRRVLSSLELLGHIDQSPNLRLEPLARPHLLAFDRVLEIPEMHDRFIAATSLVHDAPVITRDPIIQAHPLVRTIW